MRYVSIQKWNQEYAGKIREPRLFYNPDNSVAIFDEADNAVWDYILEHGVKLKENGFVMNEENYQAIVEYLKANPKENKEVAAAKEAPAEAKPTISKEKAKAILKDLEKPTVAKVADALKQVVKLLSE